VVAQGIAVVLLGRLDWRLAVEVIVVSVALAGLVHQAWVHRMRLNHRIDMLLVMGVFGGLGMLAGWWVDLGFAAPPADATFHAAMGHGCGTHAAADQAVPMEGMPSDCCDSTAPPASTQTSPGADSAAHDGHGRQDHGGSFWPMVFSWMTGLMLLGAIPPGLLLTRCADLARTSTRRWVSTHLVGNALMIAGMVWLGHAIGPMLTAWTGSAILGGHLGMLLGMLLGMEVGMFLGEAALGLAPWREWTWRSGSTAQGSPV
jgi:hypothetical protein